MHSPNPTPGWAFTGPIGAQDAAWLAAVASNSNTESNTGPSAYDGYATNVVIDAALASLSSGRPQLVLQETDRPAGPRS